MRAVLAAVAGIANLAVCPMYLRSVLAGRARPHLLGWVVWMATLTVVVAAEAALGVTWALVLPATQLVGMAGVCLVGWRGGYRRVGLVEVLSLAFCAAGVLYWMASGSPLSALVAAIAAAGTGSAMTFAKAWSHPGTEPAAPYLLGAGAAVMTMVAAGGTTPAALAYPIYLIAADVAISLTAVRRPRRVS